MSAGSKASHSSCQQVVPVPASSASLGHPKCPWAQTEVCSLSFSPSHPEHHPNLIPTTGPPGDPLIYFTGENAGSTQPFSFPLTAFPKNIIILTAVLL